MAVGWLDTERGPTCVCGMPTYVTLVDVGPKKLTLLVCFAHDGVGASFCLPSERPETWPHVTGDDMIALVNRGCEEHMLADRERKTG